MSVCNRVWLSGLAEDVLLDIEATTEVHPNHFSLPNSLHLNRLHTAFGAVDLTLQLLQLWIGLLGLFDRQWRGSGKRDAGLIYEFVVVGLSEEGRRRGRALLSLQL